MKITNPQPQRRTRAGLYIPDHVEDPTDHGKPHDGRPFPPEIRIPPDARITTMQPTVEYSTQSPIPTSKVSGVFMLETPGWQTLT